MSKIRLERIRFNGFGTHRQQLGQAIQIFHLNAATKRQISIPEVFGIHSAGFAHHNENKTTTINKTKKNKKKKT
jgi:hypothetical protein